MKLALNIPKAWNELPPTTLKKIAWHFHKQKAGKELDLLIFFTLLNIRWWQFSKYLKVFKILKLVSMSELKNHFSFIYESNEITKFIPTLKIKGGELFAPGDRLHNITIKEFAVCEDLFFYYEQKNEIEYIRLLAAVLYREKVNGKKIPFDKNELDETVKKLSKIDKKTLLAIYMIYKGSTLEIQNAYKYIFKRVPPTANLKSRTPKAPQLEEVIQFMAGGKFGNLQQTEQTNVHSFLKEYNNMLKPKK